MSTLSLGIFFLLTFIIAVLNIIYFYVYFMYNKKIVVLDKSFDEYTKDAETVDTIEFDLKKISTIKGFDAMMFNTLPFIFNIIIYGIYLYVFFLKNQK
jgi:hypothetical protein